MQLFSGKAEHMPKIGEERKFILGLWKWCQYRSNNYNCNFEFSSTQSLVPLYVDQCWMCSSAQSWRRRIFRFSHSSGWWFQTCGLFSYILGISSYQLTFAPWFFRGVGLNHQPALVLGNPRKSSISHRFPIDFPKINHRFPRKSSISHRFPIDFPPFPWQLPPYATLCTDPGVRDVATGGRPRGARQTAQRCVPTNTG